MAELYLEKKFVVILEKATSKIRCSVGDLLNKVLRMIFPVTVSVVILQQLELDSKSSSCFLTCLGCSNDDQHGKEKRVSV